VTLSDKRSTLARLSTAVVLGEWDEVRRLRASAPAGEPDREWREAVLQTHLFAGFPRLVEAYGVLAECGGLGPPEPGEETPDDEEALRERGRALFERIYAGEAEAVRALLAGHQPAFADWIESHAYGRVLSRPGLSPDRRELLATCALAALGQERQLASHARGSLRCGATPAQLEAALAAVRDLVPPGRYDRALRLVQRLP